MIIPFSHAPELPTAHNLAEPHVLIRDMLSSGFLELVERDTQSGAQMPIEAFLSEASRLRGYAALIDTEQSWNPEHLSPSILRHILWVRCRGEAQALRAADILIRDENFRIILLDLRALSQPALRQIPQSHWYRLQRIAQSQNATLIATTSYPSIAASQIRIDVSAEFDLDSFYQKRSHLWTQLQASITRQRVNTSTPKPWIRVGTQTKPAAQAS
ncbi:MAG: hypothetical protein AAF212_00940 [Verrucomicrobiota bacterium]